MARHIPPPVGKTLQVIFSINVRTHSLVIPRAGNKLSCKSNRYHEDKPVKTLKKDQFEGTDSIFGENPFLQHKVTSVAYY